VSKSREPKAEIKVARKGRETRVYAAVGGKDVSRVYISPQQLKVGPAAEVCMAGIGGVGTSREFRGKGLARRVYEQTMQEIEKDGYSCAGLFTSTNIVAHRLYRRFGYLDVKVFPPVAKLLNPSAFVGKTFADWAKREPLADWRGTVAVHLRSYPPVYLRLDSGEVKTLPRAPKQADLSITTSDTTFGRLSWGGMTFDYAMAANQLEWSGSDEAFARLREALHADRPCVFGY
jgi:ribosomal protein S18 acetylase RimI-like enzyme